MLSRLELSEKMHIELIDHCSQCDIGFFSSGFDIKSADIFPKMRSLTDEDLFAISGHILLQPKVVNEKWGGGKIYY